MEFCVLEKEEYCCGREEKKKPHDREFSDLAVSNL